MKVEDLKKGDWVKVVNNGEVYLKNGVYELAENFNKEYACIYIFNSGYRHCPSRIHYSFSLPTELRDAYPGAIIKNNYYERKVFFVNELGAIVSDINFLDSGGNAYWSWEELEWNGYKLKIDYPTPEKMIEIKGKKISEDTAYEILKEYFK